MPYKEAENMSQSDVTLHSEDTYIKWIRQEMEDIEQQKAELTEEWEELEKRKREIEVRQKHQEQEKKLFDMKWKILERELRKMAEEQRHLEEQREYIYKHRRGGAHASVAYYGIFFNGVSNELALKKRYKDLIKIFHPDNLNGDTNTLQEINHEYAKLKEAF
jgi:DNA repair exonuclease SbcCD ATPase subunit